MTLRPCRIPVGRRVLSRDQATALLSEAGSAGMSSAEIARRAGLPVQAVRRALQAHGAEWGLMLRWAWGLCSGARWYLNEWSEVT